jgi:transcriptional regulator with XRE-family HTH domain
MEDLIMFLDFGLRMKTYRKQNNITLNELANKLYVSKSYLSKLENDKTTTIKLAHLQLLQKELNLFPNIPSEWRNDNISLRMLRANHRLHSYYHKNPQIVEYILSIFEKNIKEELDDE